MPTLLLTALVLCFAEPVLPSQDTESIQSCMLDLSEGLKLSSSHHNWDRLRELEQVLARSKPGKEGYRFKTNMLEAFVFSITAGSFQGLNLSSSMPVQSKGRQSAWLRGSISFPVELMEGMGAQEEQKLVCIYIQSASMFLDEHNSSVLNNHILGAFLHNRRVRWLRRPVEIHFSHDKELDSSNATCVFWQPAGTGSAGSWSREGCETQHQKGTVRCLCNHLTYFAVLLIQAHNLSESELQSLTYISTVGCSISATAAFCTLLLCFVFRCRPRDDTTRIHMNLLAALLLLNTSFLLSEPLAAGTMGGCQAAAALLHGSLLCALGWMGAEGFHLYLLLIKVYNIYVRHYLLKLCLCTWGLPTLAVVAVLIFKRETYGHHIISTADGYKNVTMCWLTSPSAHYMTLCYAGLILLFNVLVLVAVVVVLRKMRQQQQRARRDCMTVLGLTCLLGTTWGTAFCAFGVLLVPQLYLFTILNSLQGVFLCLWYLSTDRSKRGSDRSVST
ncbi:adhesion G-protein coupled receptor G5 isoform X2 [Excalfactoria chinensis]